MNEDEKKYCNNNDNVFVMNILNNIGHPVTPSYVDTLKYLNICLVFLCNDEFWDGTSSSFWGSLGDTGKSKYFIAIGLLSMGLLR